MEERDRTLWIGRWHLLTRLIWVAARWVDLHTCWPESYKFILMHSQGWVTGTVQMVSMTHCSPRLCPRKRLQLWEQWVECTVPGLWWGRGASIAQCQLVHQSVVMSSRWSPLTASPVGVGTTVCRPSRFLETSFLPCDDFTHTCARDLWVSSKGWAKGPWPFGHSSPWLISLIVAPRDCC